MTVAADLFPGGVNSPVRAYRAVGGEPPVLVRGEGAVVWDEAGRRYIDYVGAFGPLLLGHANRGVVEAIHSAAEAGGSFGVTGPGEVRLAQLIRKRMPSIERIRFVNSGTEAAMSALRVARAATGRDLIVKFDGGYHGHADSLLVEAGSGVATLSIPGSAGVARAVAAQTVVAAYNDLDSVEALLESHPGHVAAVIVEPVAANMGVVAPATGFLKGLRELTERAGALLIFDEVITGFRVAPGGAQALYGVRPDLTVLGKIIGGGLPVGAYGGRADLMDLVAPSGPVYQAGTLSGHPVVMAAGEAALAQLTPEVYAGIEAQAARLEAGLQVRGASVARVGSLLTLFFRERPPRNFAEARGSDVKAFAQFFHSMLEAGVLLPPSQFEAWFVSAAHDAPVIDVTLEALA
ncbi:MAG: glutamate-1-semialdehyde-2,1-aminomutase [Chloroflexi bacterium]|nr:MAG: glutamate-1-semialdehyde-2,1-aminomutase [Chloroflexota bacterium]TMG67089.1 MAG: glutamate-1-semialdehyde-2,1-aminomutase [Chloroflexota bacterium]